MKTTLSTLGSPAALSELSNENLRIAVTELSACITVATAHLLMLIAELDKREAWGDWGLKSCAHWLNWQCGIGLGAAREKVRVARALEFLPQVREAFANGTVSYSKVRALTRVATAENEEYLLMIAHHGTASHMEELVRGYKRVKRIEDKQQANQAHEHRKLEWHWDEDGSLVIKARIPAETGALVIKALEAATDNIQQTRFQENVSAETLAPAESNSNLRADALVEISSEYLTIPGQTSRAADRYQVVVHVGDDEHGVVEDGPPLAQETVERLCCDSTMIHMQSDSEGNVLNLGRKQRTVSPALRRALHHRDKGCRFPGCTDSRFVDAHHVHHWSKGGETNQDNLVLLCRHHHRLLHEGGYTMMHDGAGVFEFYSPSGEVVPSVVFSTAPAFNLNDVLVTTGKNVSAETLLPNWCGERMDIGMAVEGLL